MPYTQSARGKEASVGVNSSTLSVLSVLKCFAQNQAPLSVAEISKTLEISRNMAFRAVSLLESLNYVLRDASGRKYQLSCGILDLCNERTAGFDIRSLCVDYITRIQDITGETVSLSIPVGITSVVVEGVEPPVEKRFGRLRIGGVLPLHGGAGPRAILSCFSDDEIERYVAATGPLKQRTGKTMSTRRLWQEIEKIREIGYALSIPEYVDSGTQHISFPVVDFARRPHGSITVTGPADRLTLKRIEGFLSRVRPLIEELNEQSQLIPSSAALSIR